MKHIVWSIGVHRFGKITLDLVSSVAGFPRVNVALYVQPLKYSAMSFKDLDFLLTNLRTSTVPKTIIYVNTRKEAESVAVHLRSFDSRFPIHVYHAMKSETKKGEILESFKVEHPSILCSTEAAGMGKDISDVELVIQFLLPTSINTLVQRIGRCARS